MNDKIYCEMVTEGIKNIMSKIKEIFGIVRDTLDDLLWELPQWVWRIGFFAIGYVTALFFN